MLPSEVARKRSWSFFERCRWQVTAKHACTAHTWLGIKWHCKLVRGCTVYTEHVPKKFRVQSEWGTESISWPAMTAHYVRHYCAQSRFQFPDPTSPPSRPRINTLGSSLAFDKYNNKDPSRLRLLTPGMRVNTRYINSTRGVSSKGTFYVFGCFMTVKLGSIKHQVPN